MCDLSADYSVEPLQSALRRVPTREGVGVGSFSIGGFALLRARLGLVRFSPGAVAAMVKAWVA